MAGQWGAGCCLPRHPQTGTGSSEEGSQPEGDRHPTPAQAQPPEYHLIQVMNHTSKRGQLNPHLIDSICNLN